VVVGGVVVLCGEYLRCFDDGVVDGRESVEGVVVGWGGTFESFVFFQEDCGEFWCLGAPVLNSVAVTVAFGVSEGERERDVVGGVLVVVVVKPDFGDV